MTEKTKKKQPEAKIGMVLPPHWQQVLGALNQIQKARKSRIIDPKNQGQQHLPLPIEAILTCLTELMEAVQVHTELLGALGKTGSVLEFQKKFKRHYRPINPADLEVKDEK